MGSTKRDRSGFGATSMQGTRMSSALETRYFALAASIFDEANRLASAGDPVLKDSLEQGLLRMSEYGANWKRVRLQHAVDLFVPDSPSMLRAESRQGGDPQSKIIIKSTTSRYTLVVDAAGYFRIHDSRDPHRKSERRYVDLSGSNPRLHGATGDAYLEQTHFMII